MTPLMQTFLWFAISSVAAWAQQITPNTPADEARIERMIATVQRTEISKLDRRLPKKIELQEWLKEQGGPNARLNWVVREDDVKHRMPDCVEADVNMSDGKILIVWVAAGHSKKRIPYVYLIDIVTGRDAATGRFQNTDLDRLREIPTFLAKLKQSS